MNGRSLRCDYTVQWPSVLAEILPVRVMFRNLAGRPAKRTGSTLRLNLLTTLRDRPILKLREMSKANAGRVDRMFPCGSMISDYRDLERSKRSI